VKQTGAKRFLGEILAFAVLGAGFALTQAQSLAQTSAQTSAQSPAPAAGEYQPKFKGDPARSESEAQALGYMRVVLRAEREYKKRHNKFTDSLEELAGTGSFTKRMAHSTDRGDYTASYRVHKDGFVFTMTPKQLDSNHRSFYAEDDAVIHGDDQKAADSDSPKVK
jgi:hypothetical protein